MPIQPWRMSGSVLISIGHRVNLETAVDLVLRCALRARVAGRTMPVHLRDLGARIEDLMAELDPVAVVSLGLWPGEPMIRLERVALNVADFAIPDNEGALLRDAVCLLKLDPLILHGWIGVDHSLSALLDERVMPLLPGPHVRGDSDGGAISPFFSFGPL